MISFSKISKQYGQQVLFVDASFQLNPGDRVGLVGPNGSGKTTLFRMIVGEETPDEGDVSVPKRLTIGYFRQDVEEMKGRSVLDEAIHGSGRAGDLHHELEQLQHAMCDPAQAGDMDRILARFGEVQEEYEHLGGYALEAQAREVLHGLGFEDDRIEAGSGVPADDPLQDGLVDHGDEEHEHGADGDDGHEQSSGRPPVRHPTADRVPDVRDQAGSSRLADAVRREEAAADSVDPVLARERR